MAQRVLITGGTGFIGGNLAQYLYKMGHDVTIMARSQNKMPQIPPGIKFQMCDLTTTMPDVINFDIIYHCASTVNDYNLLLGTNTDFTTNILGTHNLLEAVRKQNPWTSVVYVSTFFVYGDQDGPVTESTQCKPKGLYGISKFTAEESCRVYQKVFDLDIKIARLTNVYGDNQPLANQKTAAFNWMVESCVRNKTISLYDNGVIKRDYLYISDAVSGLWSVAQNGISGKTYLIGLGSSYSFNHMIKLMISHANGGKIRVVDSPGFHKRVGIGNFYIDNFVTRQQLQWCPKVDIDDGIRKTVEYYAKLQ